MMEYADFLSTKFSAHESCGVSPSLINNIELFPHQRSLVNWSVRKGRAAIFADTGLGKTRMQLAWADTISRACGVKVLILAPLAVAEQTRIEGESIGIFVTHARESRDICSGINITNYDRLHKFNPDEFGAIVLDESSIIKHHDSATLSRLMDAFASTPYKLCCSATPAPNDWTELGTHAEFLGICSRTEMLAEFFVHDGGKTQDWRLKGHARDEFWRWVSSWGAMIRSPADLGMDASQYDLPPLEIEQITVDSDAEIADGQLFSLEALTLSDRRSARRASIKHRVAACADIVNNTSCPWVIWTELNTEGDILIESIPDAVEIRGSDTSEYKEKTLAAFQSGKVRVLVTKPKIAGFGLNWQHCSNIAFIGVTDSFEAYYQAVRRCWRFGQKSQVNVKLFVSKEEGQVLANLMRKEKDAKDMFDQLSRETMAAVRDEVLGQKRTTNEYKNAMTMKIPQWLKERHHENNIAGNHRKMGAV